MLGRAPAGRGALPTDGIEKRVVEVAGLSPAADDAEESTEKRGWEAMTVDVEERRVKVAWSLLGLDS
jgi:hypothetical protein